jgi:hypothetical protein
MKSTEKRYLFLLAVACCALILAAGCSKDNSNDSGSAATDEQAITQLMSADSDIDDVNAFEGNSDLGFGDGGPLDDPITPIRWGRIGTLERRQVVVDFQGDSLATITSAWSFNGQFRVVTPGLDSGSTIVYDKPMQNVIVRKAHAKRIGRTRFPRDNWKIYEVTPVVLTSLPVNEHSVEPVRVVLLDSTAEGMVQVADITDPLNTWFNRDNLPIVRPESIVLVQITENNPTPAVGVMHPHLYRLGPRPRLIMNGDSTDTFTGSYGIGPRGGVFIAGLDLIDRLTIYDSVAPYNAGAWAVPYRVAPQASD